MLVDDRPEAAPPPAQPSLGVAGWLRWAWRQLTSMRTALFLLMLLAVAAVPGSVIPQRGIDAVAVQQYVAENPDLGPWLDRLGFFDVYASPWFSAIYLLLFVSLVGCVLPRSRAHLAALRSRPPRTPRRLERLPAHRTATVDAPVEQVLVAAHAVLRGRRYRADTRDDSVAAERGHLRETGNLLFHLALVGLLVAVAAGGLLGYRGQVIVPVGQAFANSLADYDTFDPGAWFDAGDLPPFRLSVDELRVAFEEEAGGNQFGAPRLFEADVTVVPEPGAEPERRTIRVNEPTSIGGAQVYLAGNGYAPRITVRDGNGDVAFSGQVPFLAQDDNYSSTGVVKVVDAAPQQIGLSGLFLPTAVVDPQAGPISVFPDARDPRLFLTAWVGDLGLDDGVPQSVYELDTSGLTQLQRDDGAPFAVSLAPGESVELPDGAGTVEFSDLDRFAGLTIRHDPGKGAALAFSVLAMAGLVASLFVPRRRVWVRAVPAAGGRTVVEVAALARGDDAGLGPEVEAVERALRERLAPPAGRSTGG
ncbi:MAG: cytochrome c biogenesis protein ResB [Actinomycetes bacterium]